MSDSSAFLISRADLAPIFGQNPRVQQQFEELQRKVAEHEDSIGANVAATTSQADASYVTLSPNAELTNEFVFQVGNGLALDAADGIVTLTVAAPIVTGGFNVQMAAQGDSTLVLPLTGVLATREWVSAQGFSTGGAAWGSITGTLSAQTDLQTALNAKADLTGATFSGSISASNLSGTNTGDQTSVSGNAGTATKLATGRTIAMTGDVTWTSPSFDGSGNVTAAGTLAASGVTAGTYGDSTHVAQVTVDAKGRVTGASNVGITGIVFNGALVVKSADQTAANYTAGVTVAWDSETYDTGGWHDNVTNNTRLTVPSGVNYVVLSGMIQTSSDTASTWGRIAILKNGGTFPPGAPSNLILSNATSKFMNVSSAPMAVSAGDYFEFWFQEQSDTSITVVAAGSWFSIQAVG